MPSQKAVFIDIDHTVIDGASVNLLVSFAYKQKLLHLGVLFRTIVWHLLYKFNLIKDFSDIITKTEELLQDVLTELRANKIDQVMADCFEQEIKPRIYPESVTFLNDFHKNGYQIYFISSTLQPLAALVRDYFGFGKIISTELEQKNGHYTGEINGSVCYGQEKLKRINMIIETDGIDLKNSYAFSDHLSDVPMLKRVGHAVVVNPNFRLKRLALKNKWEIRNMVLPKT